MMLSIRPDGWLSGPFDGLDEGWDGWHALDGARSVSSLPS